MRLQEEGRHLATGVDGLAVAMRSLAPGANIPPRWGAFLVSPSGGAARGARGRAVWNWPQRGDWRGRTYGR